MYNLFKDAEKLIYRKPKVQDPRPDNVVFRLHYQYTFTVLSVCVILVTSYGYIDSAGSAIQCMADKAQIPSDVLNGYCWISSTFTLPKHFEGEPGVDNLHHGVGPEEEGDERVYHAYYQWVPFFLSFQAIMFYVPHWIWKMMEGKKFDNLINGLNLSLAFDGELRSKKIQQLAEYMQKRRDDRLEHRMWALKFYFCEFLNLVNVIFQICLTNTFLGYAFSEYGLEVLSFTNEDPENRVDPMSRVFPRVTKCRFEKYGGSGTIQNFDALCVLGMNIINEKIFIFLWFWYIMLAVITCGNLVYRFATWFIPSMRGRLVLLEGLGFRANAHQSEQIALQLQGMAHGDWLIVYYLAQSMDKTNFYNFLVQMCGSEGTQSDEDNEEEENDKKLDDSTLRMSEKKESSKLSISAGARMARDQMKGWVKEN